jgi:hypothetical protein
MRALYQRWRVYGPAAPSGEQWFPASGQDLVGQKNPSGNPSVISM